jgi:hypothetical protein
MLQSLLYAYIDESQISYAKLKTLCKETIPSILMADEKYHH